MSDRDEILATFKEINKLTEGQNDETVEYYALLEELYGYGYCMSDVFRIAFEDEVLNIHSFENKWKQEI